MKGIHEVAMGRADRAVGRDGQQDILRRARYLHLGLALDDQPYVVATHYGFEPGARDEDGAFCPEGFTFWLHSAKAGLKLEAMERNPKFFVQVETDVVPMCWGDRPCSFGAAFESVMGAGVARLVADEGEKVHGLDLLVRQQAGEGYEVTGAMAAGCAVIRVDVPHPTGKRRPLKEHLVPHPRG